MVLAYDPKTTSANIHDTTGAAVEIWKDFKTGRFWRHFLVAAFAAVGFFAAVFGLYDIIFPGVISHEKAGISVGIIVISIAYGAFRSWPRPIEEQYNSPNVKISLVKGDLFDQDGHLVIGMCTTFDTSIPDIIARSSVQGQFLDRVFSGSVADLDTQLERSLSRYQSVGRINKPGKQEKYAIGTVATLKEHTRRYFCVAYTEMNERNEARGTMDDIWRSLDSLWKAITAEANGGRVCIPVIGGGQSRLSQVLPAQDSIRFIAMSFMFASRSEKICDELVIVARQSEYERLDRLEVQSFLRSLRPS
jgi:hypothetical protein